MAEWMDIPAMADDHPEKAIHMDRYRYATSALTGKRVLDCACGSGYGSQMLSERAAVDGVDIDPVAIATATSRYPSINFIVGDLYTYPLDGYDALVSFETLEHLDRPSDVIDRLPASLTEIVASVPIRPTVGWNEWHRSDFTPASFCSLIERQFTIVHLMGQPWIDNKGDLYLMVHGRRDGWK